MKLTIYFIFIKNYYYQDTVTGFLLAGVGERNIKGETNFLVVDSSNLFYNF